jgi:lactoylglutathione lyase
MQHVNIMVDDLEKGVAFYRDIVGIELDDTPDLDFPAQFFKFENGTQIHMNEFEDAHPFRSHFCIIVDDFNDVFKRLKAHGVIDIEPWGKVRQLPTGSMQMFARDPSGNLLEIASRPEDEIDAEIMNDELVDATGANELFVSGRNDKRRGV